MHCGDVDLVIEAPYDWAMYAQFPSALPDAVVVAVEHDLGRRAAVPVPVGYISYFSAAGGDRRRTRAMAQRALRLASSDHATDGRAGRRLLLGAILQRGHRGPARRIPLRPRDTGTGDLEGSKHQYPIYDAIAMGVQMMVFTYLLRRTDAQGRNVVEMWADRMSKSKAQSAVLSVLAMILIAHLDVQAVFAPHLVTNRRAM